MWKGQDAYIIGGGDSLRSFEWGLIKGKHTIACNAGFILGSEIVEIVLFGDWTWWEEIGEDRLPEFGGIVVGCCPKLDKQQRTVKVPDWLNVMSRYSGDGLAPPHSGKLAWFGNTGAMAVNLALALGARRVFLLGFDMRLGNDGAVNWHDVRHEKGFAEVYPPFIKRFGRLAASLGDVYPGCEVINVNDNSNLNVFPTIPVREHFSGGGK